MKAMHSTHNTEGAVLRLTCYLKWKLIGSGALVACSGAGWEGPTQAADSPDTDAPVPNLAAAPGFSGPAAFGQARLKPSFPKEEIVKSHNPWLFQACKVQRLEHPDIP